MAAEQVADLGQESRAEAFDAGHGAEGAGVGVLGDVHDHGRGRSRGRAGCGLRSCLGCGCLGGLVGLVGGFVDGLVGFAAQERQDGGGVSEHRERLGPPVVHRGRLLTLSGRASVGGQGLGEFFDELAVGFEVGLIDPREHTAHTRGLALDGLAGLGTRAPHALASAVRLDPFLVGDGVGFDDLGFGDLQDPCG
ncbi:hypothetical protein [Nocardioides sp. Root614]|uniref:hypothetical protein n=1 Tax=Nocardioides sp. Root614 TaxID=1736571 RepID=UPI000702A4AD|nr:hypothetical protein [Nocardioides sp. Root614]KRA29867.1 hypothetical protein ASD81_19325 [Nocardioides sp. Root614]